MTPPPAEPAPKMMLNGKMNSDYLAWSEQARLTCGTCGRRLRDHIEGVSGHAFVRTLTPPPAEPTLDVERLVAALAAVDHRIAVEFPEEAAEMESHAAALGRRSYAEAVAAEYARLATEDKPA